MGPRKKKGKRTYKSGRTYFCVKCGYYSWLERPSRIVRDMWDVSGNSTKAIICRTCNDCRAGK